MITEGNDEVRGSPKKEKLQHGIRSRFTEKAGIPESDEAKTGKRKAAKKSGKRLITGLQTEGVQDNNTEDCNTAADVVGMSGYVLRSTAAEIEHRLLPDNGDDKTSAKSPEAKPDVTDSKAPENGQNKTPVKKTRLRYEAEKTMTTKLEPEKRSAVKRTYDYSVREVRFKNAEYRDEGGYHGNGYVTKGKLQFEESRRSGATEPGTTAQNRGAYSANGAGNTTGAVESYSANGAGSATQSMSSGASGSYPGAGNNMQKERLKKEYADAVYEQKTGRKAKRKTRTASTKTAASKAAAEEEKKTVVKFLSEHKGVVIVIVIILILLILLMTPFITGGAMLAGSGSAIISTTYASSDEAILAVDEAYSSMETGLQNQIQSIPSIYSGYDEYRYNLDSFGYDSYVLTSYLTAVYGSYELSTVSGELISLFDAQYDISVTSTSETRYSTYYDAEGKVHTIAYEWNILSVTLVNNGLDSVVADRMTAEQKESYDLYQNYLGNRSYLFGDTRGGTEE